MIFNYFMLYLPKKCFKRLKNTLDNNEYLKKKVFSVVILVILYPKTKCFSCYMSYMSSLYTRIVRTTKEKSNPGYIMFMVRRFTVYQLLRFDILSPT
jgi:hypothetical protein